jgi:hypothetical protein
VLPPPANESTAPNINPVALRPPEPTTSPARPKVLRADPQAASPPAPAPRSIDLTPRASDEGDEFEAKTIPAAALPDEIRELTRRMAEAAAARTQASAGLTTPAAAPARSSRPNVSAITEPLPVKRPAPVANAQASVTTEPERKQLMPVTDANPALVVAKPRDADGETLSITNRGAPPSDWDDDEDDEAGVRTTIAKPSEVLGQISRHSEEDMRPTRDLEPEPSQLSLPGARGGSWALVVVLVVLALLAFVGVLVLLDVIPLGAQASSAAEAALVVRPAPDAPPSRTMPEPSPGAVEPSQAAPAPSPGAVEPSQAAPAPSPGAVEPSQAASAPSPDPPRASPAPTRPPARAPPSKRR